MPDAASIMLKLNLINHVRIKGSFDSVAKVGPWVLVENPAESLSPCFTNAPPVLDNVLSLGSCAAGVRAISVTRELDLLVLG